MKGVQIELHEEGEGETVPKGTNVTVHYTGKLEDGSVFDSSVTRGTPFTFQVGKGKVIAGWDIAITKLKKGDKATITIPAHYGYGAHGSPPVIPKDATLIFDIEVIDFEKDNNDKGCSTGCC